MFSKSTFPFITFKFLLVIICCAVMAPHASAGVKKVVRILDSIPTHNPFQPPNLLLVHCRSKDDDLGLWTMTENDKHEFEFRVNFWGTTLFWCDFNWGAKIQNVVVFDAEHDACKNERYCNWIVKTDGFYFAKGETPLDTDFKLVRYWKDLTQ